MEEELFLELIKDRDAAMARVAAEYGGLIRYVVSGILNDAQETEDCVADVYLRIWEKAESYTPGRGHLKSWLTAIARNAAVDRLRRGKHGEEELREDAATAPSPEEEVLAAERKAQLARALSELSDTERRLVYRKYYYLQSNARIAAELGVTERTVEGRLYRVRKKLKGLLGGEENG